MNTAERIVNRKNDKWFKILVDEKYQFNREVQQATEEEIREAGFDHDIVLTAFRFKNLQPDFIRQIVEYDKTIKKELENELIYDIHGYSIHASAFYQNMYIYLQLNLAEYSELKYYNEQVGQMYIDQMNKEYGKSDIAKFIDYNGKVQDIIVI